MENQLLRVELFPEAGAKIYHFIYKPFGHDFMWHNPKVDLQAVTLGQSYDDNFSGGWDELFPNDAPGVFQGRTLADHGELWCRPWEYQVLQHGPQEVEIYLRLRGTTVSALLERWITLKAGQARLFFRHRITNTGSDSLNFLWKLHPALAVNENCRVDVPGRQGEFVDSTWSRLEDPHLTFDWPLAKNRSGQTADLSQVLPFASGKNDFVYVNDLREGWCAMTDTAREVGFALTFPKEVFPFVWLFMPAGGWRGIQTVILEPCNTCPKDLDVAWQRGAIGTLAPGEVLNCQTSALAYAGVKRVTRIDQDGSVADYDPAPGQG